MGRNEIRTVAITRFSALGDVAMSVPVVYEICRTYPDIRFVMVTKVATAGLFVNPPSNLVVDGVDLKNRFKGAAGIFKLFGYLRRTYGFDTLVDLHDVTRTKLLRLLARMSGVKVSKIDKDRRGRRLVVNRRPGEPLRQLPTSFDRYRRAFASAGLKATRKFSTIFDGAVPDYASLSQFAPEKCHGDIWIAVAPFAAHRGKIYPEPLMKQVVDILARVPRVTIFMFGAGADEAAAIDRMSTGLGNIVSMAGKKAGFARELVLLSRMDVALTMDSGNMHLASLVATPVVSIWGQTHPACGFYGYGQNPANAIGAPMECRPCSMFGNRQCRFGDYRCLTLLRPEEIAMHVKRLIGVAGPQTGAAPTSTSTN